MFNELEKYYESGELAAIYSDTEDMSHFNVGFIVGLDEDCYVVSGISVNGLEDGLLLRPTDLVYRVDRDSQYLKGIKKLMNHNGYTRPNVEFTDDIFIELVKLAIKKKYICTMLLLDEEEYIICRINSLDEELVSLTLYDENMSYNGVSTIDINVIMNINANGVDEQNMGVLIED